MIDISSPDRRAVLTGLIAGAAITASPAGRAGPASLLMKTIPSTGEQVPAIGMGSWLTFDVGDDEAARAQRTEVLRTFFAKGGRIIDSSPMYGSSQAVIGDGLERLGRPQALFAADKVWTPGGGNGPAQIERSRRRWGVTNFDLLQVHNIVDWRRHLPNLFEMKMQGKLRYVGVTTYAGLRHSEVEAIMKAEPLDFVQLTYNVLDRTAEARLLPLAAEKGIAVIANRPFREGALFEIFRGRNLPAVATEAGAANWAQFLLKFIISHPAITAAIPATRRVDHMLENMGALAGPIPDAALRAEMREAIEKV